MLETKSSKTINGTIKEDGKVVATTSASIPEKGTTSMTISIIDKEAYEANKEAAREDILSFVNAIYDAEDAAI